MMLIHKKIPSRLDIIPGFLTEFTQKLAPLGLSEEELFNVKLSVEEAVVNAIRHGNRQDPSLFVEVAAEAHNGCLTIKVVDQGEGFDFENVADPTHNHNLAKLSGRGVFLIRKLMDKVDYFDCGRGIKMIKFLKRHSIKRNDKDA
ncbi:MAG: ATP-binding protein [Candidatus Omnitrophica bacterium]|nr:ATP-binding protein [Candidatus Omnitrophota bacterium]